MKRTHPHLPQRCDKQFNESKHEPVNSSEQAWTPNYADPLLCSSFFSDNYIQDDPPFTFAWQTAHSQPPDTCLPWSDSYPYSVPGTENNLVKDLFPELYNEKETLDQELDRISGVKAVHGDDHSDIEHYLQPLTDPLADPFSSTQSSPFLTYGDSNTSTEGGLALLHDSLPADALTPSEVSDQHSRQQSSNSDASQCLAPAESLTQNPMPITRAATYGCRDCPATFPSVASLE